MCSFNLAPLTRRQNAVWPLIYTKSLFVSQKTILSKNSGQVEISDNAGYVVVSTGRNRVLGSQTSHYARSVHSLFGYHGCC